MKRLHSHLIAGAVLAVLGTVGVLMNSQQATAQGPPDGLAVRIVQPVPVPVTGSVTGTLNLAPGASVRVNNPATDPVLVRSVGDQVQPVQKQGNCQATQGTIGCQGLTYTVPAGKRLVLEYASMNACTLPETAAYMTVTTNVGGSFVSHSLPAAPPAGSPGTTNFACNLPAASSILAVGQQLHLYADAGTIVFVEMLRNTTSGTTAVTAAISGHLVDVP